MNKRRVLTIGLGLGAVVATLVYGLALVRQSQPTITQLGPTAAARPTPLAQKTLFPLGGAPSASAQASPATAVGPVARTGAAMVYDPEDSGVIMFGGSTVLTQPDGTNVAVPLNDTWLWNGKSWTKLAVEGPSSRSQAAAAYDSARHVIVLFGGSGPGGAGNAQLFQDTWTWDGARWSSITPVHSPDPRSDAAMAFDKARGELVLYGGESRTSAYISTWTWDGVDWTLRDTLDYPSARYFTSMVYDDATGQTVLFGGNGIYGQRLNDTWTWDGSTWTQLAISPPIASGWSSLAYDDAAKVVVAYVYYALDNHPVREYTIGFDGARWADRSSPSDPGPRAGSAMAYDPGFDHIVLFGGSYLDPVPYAETWLWVGGAWSRVPAA